MFPCLLASTTKALLAVTKAPLMQECIKGTVTSQQVSKTQAKPKVRTAADKRDITNEPQWQPPLDLEQHGSTPNL
ncbi:hypothetical protein ACLKA6_008583 [Drosophila palustris]